MHYKTLLVDAYDHRQSPRSRNIDSSTAFFKICLFSRRGLLRLTVLFQRGQLIESSIDTQVMLLAVNNRPRNSSKTLFIPRNNRRSKPPSPRQFTVLPTSTRDA
jgi:hypothetical protein